MTTLPVSFSKTQRYFELLYVLTERNLKIRYRGSFLGVYWSLLNPLIMTGVYTAVFGATFASYYNNSMVNYVLAAFTGLVVINFFNSTTIQSLQSIVFNGPLLNKIRLPISVIPLSQVTANIVQFLVGALPLLMLVTIFVSGNPLHLLLLLIPISALFLLVAGISLLVSALYVFFRDLPYFYELVTFFLLISSPVFYPAAIVPSQIRPFLSLNPLSPIIESFRQLVLYPQLQDATQLGMALGSSGLVALLGLWCFQRWHAQFMDLL